MARSTVQPAVHELMAQCSSARELDTTVTLGGDGFTLCAHVRVRQLTRDQMQVALACWVVNTDAARTLGGHPPAKDEYRLPPDGTAVPDEDFTGRVMDHLAVCLHALDVPHSDPDGHLAITVPRTAS